jgi:ribosomal protein L13
MPADDGVLVMMTPPATGLRLRVERAPADQIEITPDDDDHKSVYIRNTYATTITQPRRREKNNPTNNNKVLYRFILFMLDD